MAKKVISTEAGQDGVLTLSVVPEVSALSTIGDQVSALPTLKATFAEVDAVVDFAIENKDPEQALAMVQNLFAAQQLTGLAAARVIHKLYKAWEAFGMTDTFVDMALKRFGKAKDTIERYIEVGSMYDAVDALDDETKALIYGKPMTQQIALAQFQNEHGKFSTARWKKVAKTTDGAALRSQLDVFRGGDDEATEVETNRLALSVTREGDIVASKGRKRKTIGHIKITADDLKDPLVAQGIERLIHGAHMLTSDALPLPE